jgi:hypothetical protein
VRRAGDAAERNGKNAKTRAGKTIDNMFGHFMRVRISIVGQDLVRRICELIKCVLRALRRRRQKKELHVFRQS